jgi:hypothetical protein
MSLNEISLPARMVADLYTSSLIGPISPNEHKSVKFLGKNEKNILILVAQEDVPFVKDDELSFLSSVLTACKLSLADVAIVNLHGSPTNNYRFFLEQFKSKTILLFDVDTQTIDLPFNFPHFQLQQFGNSIYLSAPALQFIENQKALKTQLWNCLKTIFLPNT